MDSITLTYNKGIIIAACDAAWSEYAASGVTASADTSDKQVGRASAKFVVSSTPGATSRLATNRVKLLDLSDCVAIKMWIKCSIGVTSGQLTLLLDNTAACASPLESINIGALSANTWTQVTLTPAAPSALKDIISVGIYQQADIGACSIWIDDIYATLPSTTYSVLSVKGMSEPELLRINGQHEELLDFSYFSQEHSFQRQPEIDFGVIQSQANRVSLFRWLYRRSIQQITYGSETLDVVLQNPAQVIAEWENGFSDTRSFQVGLIEKTPRRSIPASWSS